MNDTANLRRSARPKKKTKPFTPDPTPPEETQQKVYKKTKPFTPDATTPEETQRKKVYVSVPTNDVEIIQSLETLETTPKKNPSVAEKLIANLGQSKCLFFF